MMQDLKTRTQNYPKPHVNNVLQDDVRRIGEAFEMVDKDINEREGRYETQVDLTQYPTDYFFPVWFVAGGNDDGITRVQVLRHFSDKPLAAALNVQMDVCDYAWGGDAAVFAIRHLAQDFMKTFRRAQRSMLSVSRPIDGKHELYIKDSEGKEVNCPVQSGFYLRGGLNYKVITNTPRTIHYYQQPKPEANADYAEVQIAWRRDVDGNKRPYENQWMVKPYHEDDPNLGEDYAEIRPANSQQELEKQMNAAEANAKAASLPRTGGVIYNPEGEASLQIQAKNGTNASLAVGECHDGEVMHGVYIDTDGLSQAVTFSAGVHGAKNRLFGTSQNADQNTVDFEKIPTVAKEPLALNKDVQSLQQRLDDANDVYELIKAITQVMQSGGTFTPTAEAMYPDVASIDVDTQWLLRFDAVDGSLTFSDGDLKDKTAHSGDILFYNTPSNSFILIPSAQSQLLNDAVAKAVSDAKTHTDTEVAAVKTQVEQLVKMVVVSSESVAKTESAKPENQDKIYFVVA
jgi:hypothetical protein